MSQSAPGNRAWTYWSGCTLEDPQMIPFCWESAVRSCHSVPAQQDTALLLICWRTEQRPAWEANGSSASLGITCLLRNIKVQYCSWDPNIGLYPEPAESSPHFHILFLLDPLLIFSYLCIGNSLSHDRPDRIWWRAQIMVPETLASFCKCHIPQNKNIHINLCENLKS